MLFVPQGPDFQWYYSNTLTTQPSAAAYGTNITPGTTAGSYGSWSQVATAGNMAQDTYGVFICFNNGATSASARNILCEMGVDNAGGTSYQSVIPYLIAGGAYPYTTAPGGIYYYFPLYIKSGSTVAFRAMSNLATTFNVSVYFYGQPRRPEAQRVGSYVDAFGVDVNNRIGTVISPGTTNEGAWTQLGSATTRSYWWWQAGFGINSSSFGAATCHADLSAGDATNKKIINENQLWTVTSSEQNGCLPSFQNAYNNVASGQNIYGRAQQTGTPTTGTHMIAYGLGG